MKSEKLAEGGREASISSSTSGTRPTVQKVQERENIKNYWEKQRENKDIIRQCKRKGRQTKDIIKQKDDKAKG